MNYVKKLCILKQVASGFAAGKRDRDGRAVDVCVVGEGNRRDEGQCGQAVHGPQQHVRRFKRCVRQAPADEDVGEDRPHGRKVRPGRALHGQTKRFQNKARDDDEGKAAEYAGKARIAFNAHVVCTEAPPSCKGKSDQSKKTGRVKNELIDKIKRALQNARAENEVRNVPVERGNCCTPKKKQKAPKQPKVHPAQTVFANARLPKDFFKHVLGAGGGVGKDGYISVIKDLGLKEPYIGRTALINGEIASDFAYYFTASEQQPSAVALGVLVDKTGCIASGGIFVQPLPGCPDHVLTVLEDIVGNFTAVSNLFKDLGAEGIKDKYFGHFDINELEGGKPEYVCRCNRSKLEKVVLSLGRAECDDVIAEQGMIEIGCQFCGKKYIFDKNDVERLFSNK